MRCISNEITIEFFLSFSETLTTQAQKHGRKNERKKKQNKQIHAEDVDFEVITAIWISNESLNELVTMNHGIYVINSTNQLSNMYVLYDFSSIYFHDKCVFLWLLINICAFIVCSIYLRFLHLCTFLARFCAVLSCESISFCYIKN